MNDIAPLTSFRVDGTEFVVLTRAAFDLVMSALDDRIDKAAAERALAELDGREGDALTAKEMKERDKGPLRFWRKRRGLTQVELAKAAGISQAYLAEIESGAKDGGLKVMAAIARELDVAIDDLVA